MGDEDHRALVGQETFGKGLDPLQVQVVGGLVQHQNIGSGDAEAREDQPRRLTTGHARWRLGMLYEKLGRKDLARREYEMALKLDSQLEQAREALENLG